MTTAGTLLRCARRAQGLTQRSLAERAAAHQPHLARVESGGLDPTVGHLSAWLLAAGQRLVSLPTVLRPAAEAADAVAARLRDKDAEGAFREIIQLSDDLASATPDLRVALAVSPPAPTGDVAFDALLAGVVDEHLRRSRLPLPAWVREPSRRLPDLWHVDDNPFARELAFADASPGLLRHNVVLARSELQSV